MISTAMRLRLLIATAYLFLISALQLSGQAPIPLSNPSDCGLSLPFGDYTCPDDPMINFDEPNRFHINVSNTPGGILGVDVALTEVRLILAHDWISDVNVRLVSPNGTVAQLIENVGSRDDNFGDPTDPDCSDYAQLQIYACQSILTGLPPFLDGPYRPIEDLWVFNDGSTDPNGVWQLLICDDLPGETGTLEYVELVFEPIACLPVQELRVDRVDTTTVVLSYLPAQTIGNCGDVVIELGPSGFVPGAGGMAGGGTVYNLANACSPISLSGLAPESTFDAYIRRYCPSTGTYSANSCPISFQTLCQPPATSLIENFDAQANCAPLCNTSCSGLNGSWRNVSTNDFMDWIVYSGPTPSTPLTGPTQDVGGSGKYVYMESNGSACAAGSTAILQSGCFVLNKQGSDDCHLSFNYHMWGIHIGMLRLQASTDGGFSWLTIWQLSGNQGNKWNKAYVSLEAFTDGMPIQFRFIGSKGSGNFGDIALDRIVLHGSTYQGYPDQLYYVDQDQDGYGRPGTPVLSCLGTAPLGYADNSQDCNDNDASIYPEAPEVICNGIDENCNQAQLDDDIILPPPLVFSDTICSGETPTICAEGILESFIIWYTEPSGLEGYVDFAPCISPVLPPNETPFPVVYRFYAEQTNFNCSSPVRAEAVIVVNPKPDGVVSQPAASTCPGSVFDLNSVQVVDNHFLGSSVSWHHSSPAQPSNQLAQTELNLVRDTSFYFLLSSPQGCTSEGIAEIEIKPLPVISFLPADSFSLCRESSGVLSAQISGGAGNYTYLWGNGATGSQIAIEAAPQAGTVQFFPLLVTDLGGCTARDTAQLITTNSIDSIRVFTRSITQCEGTDGQITIVPLNGLSPFSYSWSSTNGDSGNGVFGSDTLRLNNLRQGSYRITITDASAEGCEVRLRNVRVQGPGSLLGEHQVVLPSCKNANNGRICLSVSGSPNLQYSWSTSDTTACIDSLSAGTYQVTITNGACTAIESFTLNEPDSLRISVQSQLPSCPGRIDGSFAVTVFGGVAPYIFDWSTGASGPGIGPIGAGTYTLSLRDANGCQLESELILPSLPLLDILTDTLIEPSCFGGSDGLLLLRAVGGDPPYLYVWDNGSTSPLQTNLATGVYGVTATDRDNCSTSRTFVVAEPPALQLFVEDFLQPLCPSEADGIIEVRAEGGTPPYLYYWNGQASVDPFLLDLGIGDYTIYAVDSKGCRSADLLVTLAPSTQMSINVIRAMPLCVGRSDGSLQVTPTGGFSPYQIRWQGGSSGSLRQNLAVGEYFLTITDGRGCQLDTSLVLGAPQVFQVAVSTGQPSCFNIADGIINPIVIQSGTGTLNYQWNDGSMSSQRNGLAAGAYQFTLTDAIGCRFVSDTVSLLNPPQLQLSTLEASANACAGDASGVIEVALSGGTPPYQYNWLGQGVTQALIEGLPAATYRLIARDSRLCTKDTTFVVSEPPPLQANIELEEGQNCLFGAPTLLRAQVAGGTPPYQYLWSNGSADTQLQDPLPGDYTLTLTDANGCQAQTGTVKVRTSTPAIALASFEVRPVRCFGGQDAQLTASVAGGSGLFRFHFSEALVDSVYGNTYTLSGLPHSSSYSVTITDLNTGCMLEAEAPASQPEPLFITRNGVEDVRCFGGADGRIFVSVQGGSEPYEYAWVNSLGDTVYRQEDLRFARDDTYTLWVRDDNGCVVSLSDSTINTINTLIEVIDSLTVVTTPPCRAEATGSIQLTLMGGAPPYQYSWSNGRQTEDMYNLPAGFYELTVTDSDTCRRIFPPIQVSQPPTSLTINTQEEDISCFGLEDGFILLGVFGGGSPYQYTWRRNGLLLPSAQGPALSDLRAADYSVQITDQNGCVRSRFFAIEEPPPLEVNIINEPVGSDSLGAVVAGGTPPYTYQWSTGEQTETITDIGSGLYSLSITDDNDCLSSASFVLVGVSKPVAGGDLSGAPSLYPNPSSEFVYVQWPKGHLPQGTIKLAVFDAAGKLVQNEQLPASPAWRISVEGLAAGMYYWLIQTESASYWLRLVVLE